ncbi:ABC transporter substrate-binding protein [Dethiosulfovibrio salsuginis]|uniref:ABC-type uncharacterized transport system, substrate-binding protein n=1 Tax=Dethiosulfovibrio salsuginis TaxID=561720 RepID=A0A1X7IRR4_9BACT|nr:ABC transporter substrate binding protein [Dethiosulfovibrio salsuginis]SMG17690.1 ABC-type uncharacterized transport system, substrate-binding protein [Dethiosulfovibrio salsuginis]
MFKKSVLLGIVLAVLSVLPRGAFAMEIFMVGSYHQGDMCGQPQYDAVVEALKQSGIPDLSFRGYYLDSRRRSPQEIDGDIEAIIGDIRELKPAMVVTVDDLAFARLYGEVLKHPSMYLVFTGLNRSVEEYNKIEPFLDRSGRPDKNVTGVFEYLFMKEQMEMLEVLLERPLDKVAVLYSRDPVGMIIKQQIEDELSSTPYGEKLLFFGADSYDEVMDAAKVVGADDTVDGWIPATMSVRDRSGGFMTMADLVGPMISVISKPDLALNSSFTELGFYGGVSVDFYQMGFQTGMMAARLLKGHSISDIPVEDARASIIAVNRGRLSDLGIGLSQEFAGLVDQFLD